MVVSVHVRVAGLTVLAATVLALAASSARAVEYSPIVIEGFFNRDFADGHGGDGDDGWTDQGGNDLRGIAGKGELLGVPFMIGGGTNGHDAVLFGNSRQPPLARSIVMDVDREAAALVFLHTAAWTPAGPVELVRYTVTYEDGEEVAVSAINGEQIANWWNPEDLSGAKAAWRGSNGEAEVGVYAMVWANPHPERRIREIEARATHEETSVFLLAITAADGVPALASLAKEEVRTDTTGWFEFAPSWTARPKASVVDCRGLGDGPAGGHGFIEARGDGFVFEDGTPFIGWGINATWMFPTHEESEVLAENLSWMGVNVFRNTIDDVGGRWSVFGRGEHESTRQLDPEAMDRFDYLVSCLKKQGIYVYLTLRWTRGFVAGDGVDPDCSDALASFLLPANRELEKEYARQLLTHVNPYTGLAYKDEPAIAAIEIINERTLFHDFKFGIPACVKPAFDRLWNAWLLERYGSREALAKAWSDEDGRTNLGEDEDPSAGTVRRPEKVQIVMRFPPVTEMGWRGRVYDARRFLLEVQRRHFAHMRDYLRSIGARQLIGLSDLQCSLPDLAVGKLAGFVDYHMYAHVWAVDARNPSVWFGSQQSQLRSFDYNFVSRLAQASVRGCPMVFGEINQLAFNETRPEAIALVAAYGCFQKWNAPMWYNFAHHNSYGSEKIAGPHEFRADMARYGLFPACATIYRKRLVSAARKRVDVLLSEEDLIAEQPWGWVRNDEGKAHPDAPFMALPYLYGIRNCLTEGVYEGGADLAASSGRTAGGFEVPRDVPYLRVTPEMVADKANPRESQWFARMVMERLGGAEARWDLSRDRDHAFVSDTGELTIDFAAGTLLIDAPAAQGICGSQRAVALKDVSIDCASPGTAYILLVATDGEPLSRSERILLTAVARAENTGMVWNGERTRAKIGRAPVLLEPVRAEVRLRRAGLQAVLKVEALGPDGLARERVDVQQRGDEAVFTIDGRYRTIWYRVGR